MTGNQVIIAGILFSFLANSERRFDNLCGSLRTRNTHSDYECTRLYTTLCFLFVELARKSLQFAPR